MPQAEASPRLIAHLPALYRSLDAGAGLQQLLGAFDELLFSGQPDVAALPGIARELDLLPALFAPLGVDDGERRTPERFLPWMASWLAFVPQCSFGPEQLRRIVAGIVPLYGRRGTRAYLEQLLPLCFDEIAGVQVDERDLAGLRLGHSRVGIDSLLAEERPFCFSVDVQLQPGHADAAAGLEARVRAVIDFAKPAHTHCQLRLLPAVC